ncbi:MAG: DUF3035 domain-containing protein [Magnetococcales bacterium]|nr:DUF3035 domain-containing protein [Magnetococcales bacterium]
MNRNRLILTLTFGCALLGGCSSTIALPWEKDNLDPGRIATHEPLEIPPDLSELPNPDAKKPQSTANSPAERTIDSWANPDAAGNKGEAHSGKGDSRLPFSIPAVHQDKEGLSRNEKEKLPGWMDAPVTVR